MNSQMLIASVLCISSYAIAASAATPNNDPTPTAQGLVYQDSKGALHSSPVTLAQEKSVKLVKKMLADELSTLEFTVQVDGSINIRLDSTFTHAMVLTRDKDGNPMRECGDANQLLKQKNLIPVAPSR